jgi:asparagine synthase (glutamine-hydrolysing)
MCGIAGICNVDGQPVAAPVLRRMIGLLAHRGPDGEGSFFDCGVGLGHRRLAIIDLTDAAQQPLTNEAGDVVVTYNGEIYNFAELRAELEGRGHTFRSRGDSEVVVHAYEEWGDSCIERFNGMFAFAIWDRPRRRLLLARDRYGIKPLYYFWNGTALVFGSEIKAILAHPAVSPRVSLEALSQYFTFQNILTDDTLFAGIRILPAGTSLTLDLRRDARPQLHRYWDFDLRRPEPMDRGEAADELHRLFTKAVSRQLVSDVPVGSYLSGGMDSGSITAVARSQLGRLTSFTCGFDLSSASGLELGFDEREKAEVLANLLKTEHYEVVLHAGDMEHVMPELIWHLEDLRVGQCYPNYYVARLAGKFVKVVLSGTGGDELMAGYPWRYYHGPSGIGCSDFLRNYYGFWQRLVTDDEKPSLFRPDVRRALGDYSTSDVFRDVLAPALPDGSSAGPEDLVNASLYFELKTFLHGLLVVEDKVSMAHGLETRVPFLDNDLVDFSLRIPAALKLRSLDSPGPFVDENDVARRRRLEQRNCDGKVILREAMSRIIPAEVAVRAKQGFSAPDASWFRGESIDYVTRFLGSADAKLYEYLEPDYVANTLSEHVSGKSNHRLLIWSLLSFEWWLRRFFN